MKKQFIGPDKVLGITQQEDLKTPMGHEVVEVSFANEHPAILMPKKAFDLLVSDTAVDYTEYQRRKIEMIGREIVSLVMEYDIKNIEILPLLKFVGDLMQDAFERASNYLWTKDDKQFVSGMSFLNNRSLLEAERVLKQIKPGDEKTGA